MATSTKFLGAARLSNRHVPEAATTEHVGEQVAGVVEQALLDLGFLLLVDLHLHPSPPRINQLASGDSTTKKA
jgi:hypothetical protein